MIHLEMCKMAVFVFIDRDGVICEEKNFLFKKENLELIPRSGEAIKILNENNCKVIVITNQSIVARGICSEETIKEINDYMQNLLRKDGARLDKIYYCPHHPTEGKDPNYTRECFCRKPKPGMILKARKDFEIKDSDECYMIGDKNIDIKAGKLGDCKTILVETGYGGEDDFKDGLPLFKSRNLYDAVVDIILKNN